jgi:formylglycine-generating enzyme required for sulfatase activity
MGDQPRGRRRTWRIALAMAAVVVIAAGLAWKPLSRKLVAKAGGYGDIGGRWDCDATAVEEGRPNPELYGCFVPIPGRTVLRFQKPRFGDHLTFLMGAQATDPAAPGYDPDASEDEGPPHLVTIRPFWLQRHEVTAQRFEWCVRLGPCREDQIRSGGYFNYKRAGREVYPANGVTWEGARTYCEWIGGRLPTEAEYEYVARQGVESTRYIWGDAEPGCAHAVMGGGPNGKCGVSGTEAIGFWPANGPDYINQTVNLVGNVWEWLADWYDPEYYARSPRLMPRGPETGLARVQRGGGWTDDDPAVFRGTFRASMAPEVQLEDVGFRCAADSVDTIHEATAAWMVAFGWSDLQPAPDPASR